MHWRLKPPTWVQRYAHVWVRAATALGVLAYIALWFASGTTTTITTDLDAFFLPAARLALAGHPWQAYAVRYLVIYPNANGPLSLVPLTLLAAIGAHLGWLGDPALRRGLILAGFAPFLLLLAYEVSLAVDRMRGIPLRPWMRLALYAVILLSPTNWICLVFYGHVEQPMTLWLVFLGTRLLLERGSGRAGVVFGLALLSRSAAVLFPLVLVLVLLRHRHLRAAVTLVVPMILTLVLGLLPFFLADRSNLLYSLAQFRSQLPVGGGNVWGLFDSTVVTDFARRWDSEATIGAAVVLCVVVLAARPRFSIESPGIYDLLGVVSLCFPLFIKTLWPYYFFEPWVFAALWWFAWRPRSRWAAAAWGFAALVPIAVLIGAGFGDDYRSTYFGPGGNGLWWNLLLTSVFVIELAALLAGALFRTCQAVDPAAESLPETSAPSLPLAPVIEG